MSQSGPWRVAVCISDRLFSEIVMLEELIIRESAPGDLGAIESLYPEAFPDENLLPLVRDLLEDAAITTSLIGAIDSQIVGHAIFTKCRIVERDFGAALLGPLAIAPAWQRRGFGTAIVLAGLGQLEEMDVNLVCVLGDPAYYQRLGFRPESLVEPPYPLPPEWDGAWQSQALRDEATRIRGKLVVPRQWLQPALWAP